MHGEKQGGTGLPEEDHIFWGSASSTAEYDRQKFSGFCRQASEDIQKQCTDENGRLRHILRAEHFTLPFLETICQTAHSARKIAKSDPAFLKLLQEKSVFNYFHQPSTRTFLSFSTAESVLGMRREEVRDIKTSSAVKGESEKDALRTISSYFDALVVRHPSDMYDLFALWVMKLSDREIPVINAGSGKEEHPTQGLLDYYTKQESFRGTSPYSKGVLDGRTILYVGDCLRGRTIHSDAKLMALHDGVTMYFLAPEELQLDAATEQYLLQKGVHVHKETSSSLRDLVGEADVIYMTRIQDEHGGAGTYNPKFIFTEDLLERMKPGAVLMHPMPKREEIDPSLDYRRRDPRLMYWRQQRNGMWVRVALLAYLFEKENIILDNYEYM